jgi:hypothetical protein
MKTYKDFKVIEYVPPPPTAIQILQYELSKQHGNLWLTKEFAGGMITLRDTYGGPIEGTTFRCFEDFRQGKRDPISNQLDSTFSQLNQLLALACPYLRTPLARMEPHALTNFIEVPYDVKVENPPDEDFKKSGPYYEARIRSLNPRVYLVLMGITKEKNYNQHAIKIIKSVNKKAIIFDSYHPLNWIWHENKKIGKDLQLKVGQFIKALGL